METIARKERVGQNEGGWVAVAIDVMGSIYCIREGKNVRRTGFQVARCRKKRTTRRGGKQLKTTSRQSYFYLYGRRREARLCSDEYVLKYVWDVIQRGGDWRFASQRRGRRGLESFTIFFGPGCFLYHYIFIYGVDSPTKDLVSLSFSVNRGTCILQSSIH